MIVMGAKKFSARAMSSFEALGSDWRRFSLVVVGIAILRSIIIEWI
jgi:hypothetical protein